MLSEGNGTPSAQDDPGTALQRTRARLLAFLQHAPEAIFIKDAEGRYVEVSRTFLDLAGKQLSDVVGRTDADIFDAEVAAKFAEEDRRVRETGKPLMFEESFPYQGQTFTFLTQKFPLPFGEVAGIATNITDRKAAQEAHERLAERLRVAMEATGIGFYENNFTTGESVWSESAFRVLCLEPRPGLKGSFDLWRSRVHPEDLDHVLTEHAAARGRTGPWSIQYRVIHPETGEVRWVLAHTQFSSRPEGDFSTGVAVDITEQKRLEEQQALLVSELNHRVKNMLAVVQSIAAQTFRDDGDPAEQRRAFESRLVALAGVHDLLQHDSWQPVSIGRVVERAIDPFQRGGAIDHDGPELLLDTRRCVSLALALHELCTNAVKYGALSHPAGKVMIRWHNSSNGLAFEWKESGGPTVKPASGAGFGTRMIERALSSDFGTTVALEFAPSGLVCRFTAPLQ